MPFAKKKSSGKDDKKKPKAAKPAKVTFPAPADFKPCFVDVMFKTQKDGLIGPAIKAVRIKGQWTNENAKRYDMMTYDATTVVSLMARIGARTFAAGVAKRLPSGTSFRLIVRVGKRTADDTILASVKSISRMVKSKTSGKSKWKEMTDKTDPVRRKLRSVGRFLPGAFVNIQLPPTKKRKEETEED